MKTDDNTVIEFRGVTKLDIPAERILRKAIEANLSTAVIVGYDQDGEFYFASTTADGGDCFWLFATAKKKLLENGQ